MNYGRLVLALLLSLCLLALFVQGLADFSPENLASACLAFAASVTLIGYLAWTAALQTHPLSTFALLGFSATTLMGALLGQSLFGVAVSFNLRQPIETFAWLAAFQFVAIGMHAFYRAVIARPCSVGSGGVRRLLDRAGLYTPPGTGTLWFMGYLGLLAFVIGSGREGVFAKTLQGMAFMTWAPFLIPMYLLQFGEAYSRWSRQGVHLVFFALLVVMLGLAANSRAVMLSGFMTVSLFALLMLLRSRERVRWSRVATALVAMAALGAVAIPVSDLATAMVVARKARGTVSAPQMVQETWRVFQQPEVLAAERAERATRVRQQYDERYIDNPLLARIVETKFHDNALYFAGTLTPGDRDELARRTAELFVIVLPTPVLNRLGFDLDKLDYQYSMGDLLAHLSHGGPLGGYRTGSMPAHGLALLGAGFLAVYAALCLVAFSLLDLLATRRRDGVVLVSAIGMLSLWDLFLGGLTGESVHGWITYYLRYLPQSIVLFLLVGAVVRSLGWLTSGLHVRPPARRMPPHPG
ncbi:MAG: hypothetical protein ACO1OR_10090 [Hydrogenophaga sp.]|jgi:lipoprotein signal peptidase